MSNRRISLKESAGCLLWIDGGGCWLLWFRDQLVWGGGSTRPGSGYQLRWPAALRTEHAIWSRSEGCHWLHPAGACELNGQEISTPTRLFDQDEISLNGIVRTQWRLPSPLCESAGFSLGEHRTVDHLDGVVLFQGACLIGPGKQTHVPCPHWENRWVIYEYDGDLWGRIEEDETTSSSVPFASLQDYQQDGWRFRFEPLTS